MYNERNDSFSIKDLIVQILFIVLFVFILIWLFPTKDNVKDGLEGVNNKFDVLTNRIFNENLQTMKEAAISYYTTPRLPKKLDDVETMTLGEMLEKKLLIEFRDANNKACDLDDSYVSITKLEDEYLLKVNLSCTDNDAYILVHLGCYDYCLTDVCENKNAETPKPIENVKPKPTPTPTPTPNPEPNKPTPEKPQVTCSYKYEKVISNSVWSGWSEWSTKVEEATNTKQVETKEETTTEEKKVTKYKDVEYEDKTKPIVKEVYVQNGDPITVTYCSEYTSQYTPTGEKKYEWIDQGTSYYTTQPKPDKKTKYEYVDTLPSDCGDCINGVIYIYRKYTLKVYNVVKEDEVCKTYSRLSAPVYMVKPILLGYEKYTKKEPYTDIEIITNTIKYYRFRTLSTTYTTLVEWSSIQNDQKWLSQGYKYITSVCK